MNRTWLPTLSASLFESGLRIDRVVATLDANRETFRANLVRCGGAFQQKDLLFFRALPHTLRIAALADESRSATVRDLPLVGRLAMETRKVDLRVFRATTHPEAAAALTPPEGPTPSLVLAFFTEAMRPLAVIADGLPELVALLSERSRRWVESHPEVADAQLPVQEMSPLTRRRYEQAGSTLSASEIAHWSRATVAEIRHIAECSLEHRNGHV